MRFASLALVVSAVALALAPACSTKPAPAHVAMATQTLTIGPGPAASALTGCLCSTCVTVCAESCAPGAPEITGAPCKACMATANPDGCLTELTAYQVESAPVFPAPDCATDRPELPTCSGAEVPVDCNGDATCPSSAPMCVECCPAAKSAYPVDSCQ
jgi:hypothetical protein